MKKFTILRNEGGDAGGGGAGAGQAAGDAGAAGSAGAASGQSLLAGGAAGAGSQGSGAAAGQAAAGAQAAGAAQGSKPFDFRSVIGDDGNFVPNFHTALPEDWKGLDKFKNPAQLLEGYNNLQTLLGKKSDAVIVPAADAPREEWAPLLKKLGVPDSPDGYGLKIPEKLPEGVTVSQEEITEFGKLAHEIGLTPQQAAKLQAYDMDRTAKSAVGMKTTMQQVEERAFAGEQEKLAKAWGTGPEAAKQVELAQRAALTLGFSTEDVKGGNGLFRNAAFVQAMAKAGALMSEDALVKGSDAGGFNNAKTQADDIITNPANPEYAKYWAGDEAVNNKVRNLIKQAG